MHLRPLDRASHCGAATPQSQITRLLNSTVNKSQNTLKKYSLFPVYRPIIQQKLSNISKTQMQTVLKLPKKAHKLRLSGLTACPKKGTLDTNGKSHNPFHISSLVASSSLFHSSLLASRTPICWIKLRVPPTNIQESPALRAKKRENVRTSLQSQRNFAATKTLPRCLSISLESSYFLVPRSQLTALYNKC